MEEGVSEDSKNEVNKVVDILKNKGYEVKEISLPMMG